MAKTLLRIAIPLVLAGLLFYGLAFFLYNDAYGSLAGLFFAIGIDPFSNHLQTYLLIGLASVMFFINAFQVALNRLFIPFFKIESIVYSIMVLAVILLKSNGIQGWNLDVSNIFSQVIEYPTSVILNMVLFIPLGGTIYALIKSPLKAFGVALCSVIGIEFIQYIFSLGIADVVDVMLNMMGFTLGYLVPSLLSDYGIVLAKKKNPIIGYFAYKPELRDSHAKDSPQNKAFTHNRAGLIGTLICTILFIFILGYTYYDYQSYQPWEEKVVKTEDETLSKLPEAEAQASLNYQDVLETISPFQINGERSSNSWMLITEDNQFQASGAVCQFTEWYDEQDILRQGITLSVPETLSGITVLHAIPLIVTGNTEIICDDQPLSFAIEEEKEQFADTFFNYGATVRFSLQEGWLEADSIVLSTKEHVDPALLDATIDYEHLTSDNARAKSTRSESWLDARTDSISSLTGYIDSYTTEEGRAPYFTMRILDTLGSALICHSVRVEYQENLPSFVFSEENFGTVDLKAKDGSLVYAEG